MSATSTKTVGWGASLLRMLKRLGTLMALLVSGVVLGGCVSIQGVPSGSQQEIVGELRVSFTVCASGLTDGAGGNEDHPGCPDMGNSGMFAFEGAGGAAAPRQLLLALRIPVGATAPETVSVTPGPVPPAIGSIVLRRNATYEAELQAALPPAPGSRWQGYLSDVYDFTDGPDGTGTQNAQVAIDIGLPRPPDGSPFIGSLAVRPVVGARLVDADLPASRAVECGDSPFATTPSGFSGETICIDSPAPGPGFNQAGSDLAFPTRDFGVLAGKATASPGQTVSLPFNVRGAGALPAGLTAALSATTVLPGAGSVTPSVASTVLSNGSDTRVTVPVAIPKEAGPGVFDVTLTGRLENGQTRTGVAKLTVRDRQKPVLSKLKAKPKRFKAATKKKPKRGTDVSFALSEAASVRLSVERCAKRAGKRKRKRGRCVRWRTMKGGLTKPGVEGANQIRFNGRLRGRALKAGGYRLVVAPTDGAANRGAAVRTAIAIRRA
ncbi:MAG TPA: hypothetical protein VEW67_11625 [Thermoleophilaceae bacterium]|nr:hypothetical protein [Thermoleophilaceae bacterium]